METSVRLWFPLSSIIYWLWQLKCDQDSHQGSDVRRSDWYFGVFSVQGLRASGWMDGSSPCCLQVSDFHVSITTNVWTWSDWAGVSPTPPSSPQVQSWSCTLILVDQPVGSPPSKIRSLWRTPRRSAAAPVGPLHHLLIPPPSSQVNHSALAHPTLISRVNQHHLLLPTAPPADGAFTCVCLPAVVSGEAAERVFKTHSVNVPVAGSWTTPPPTTATSPDFNGPAAPTKLPLQGQRVFLSLCPATRRVSWALRSNEADQNTFR